MYATELFGRLEVRTRGVGLSGRDFGGVEPRHILALLGPPRATGQVGVDRVALGRPLLAAPHVATVTDVTLVSRGGKPFARPGRQ
jgi:hypothetical protein